MTTFAEDCEVHGLIGILSCAKAETYLVVHVVAALRDPFVTLQTFMLLLSQESLQGSVGYLFPLGREERLQKPCIEDATTFTEVGHLYADSPLKDLCNAKIHVGLAFNPRVLW